MGSGSEAGVGAETWWALVALTQVAELGLRLLGLKNFFKIHLLPLRKLLLPALPVVQEGGPWYFWWDHFSTLLGSDAHMEAFNEHLFKGCKLHEGRTLLVLFSGTLRTRSNAWPGAGGSFVWAEHRINLLPPALQHKQRPLWQQQL